MKAPLLVAGFGICAASAWAQDFVAPGAPRDLPIITEPTVPRPTVEGIVKEIFNTQKPWQLVSPLAPKSAGNGEKTVSYSEHDPGKPKGFILFAVEW